MICCPTLVIFVRHRSLFILAGRQIFKTMTLKLHKVAQLRSPIELIIGEFQTLGKPVLYRTDERSVNPQEEMRSFIVGRRL